VPITAESGELGQASPTDEQRRQAATALLERYDARLRRTARRYSLCAADADDAYQRAIEILLRKAPVTEPERLVRWMHTVTRHEAYAVRRQREKLLDRPIAPPEDGPELDPIDLLPHDGPEPSEGLARKERVVRSFEALKALKPQELRTLTLKAEGYSYVEIEEITGFSQTKINRCMVEGRRRFLDTFADIEEGRRCDALAPALSRFCDGELDDAERSGLMEHLGQCAHCRSKLRAFRETPRRVLALAPVGMLAAPSAAGIGDRLAITGDRIREAAASLLHRGSGAVEASQTLAVSGGGRGSGFAVLALVCGVGAAGGGAAVCVDQGVLPNPLADGPKHEREAQPSPAVAPAPEPEPEPVPAPDPAAQAAEPQAPATAAQVRAREFEPQPSGGSEFGAPASAASGGGSGGGGSGGGPFGFEK
jgi:RNA polymerase sigma factor (sigma-70 family)